MYVDVRAYFRFMYLAFFRAGDLFQRLTAKRAIGLVFFFLIYPLFELFTALCLALDHVFFPGFRCVTLDKALFIVGHPRSGTTYLQQLIARDEQQFFGIKTWEALFPSILQKKVLSCIGRIDRKLGGRLRANIERREQRRTDTFAKIHEMGLFKLTEEDRFFLHTFTSHGILWMLYPGEPGWQFHFDRLGSERDRDRAMRFFRACLKRHAYFKGTDRFLMSKSPFASLRVQGIYKHFPGCRVIYTVRNPMDTVPSMLDFGRTFWDSDPNRKRWATHQQEWIYNGMVEMYRHPLQFLPTADPATWEIVRFPDLMRDTEQTVRAVYGKLGYKVTPAFAEILQQEKNRQREFRSKHPTTLESFNLTRERILSDFKEVFARCNFPTEPKAT
jgi:hypothetical protein